MTAPEEQQMTTPELADDAVAEQVDETVESVESAPDAVVTRPAPIVMDRPVQTVGRRKEAVVRIRLMPGTGNYTLNGKSLAEYFPNKVHQQLINDPFVVTERTEIFDVHARLHGGGTSGQAGALRLAIARALIEVQPEDRPALKRAGFLTRDPRMIERKKYGLKKARKAP
ncbi:MAG: 30S ribosomal protein S9, partial [Mycobacteriaceae bacterium]